MFPKQTAQNAREQDGKRVQTVMVRARCMSQSEIE